MLLFYQSEAVSAVLADRDLRIAMQHYERLPGRVAILAQLAPIFGGLNVLPKRGGKPAPKAEVVQTAGDAAVAASAAVPAAGGKKAKGATKKDAAAAGASQATQAVVAVALPAPVDAAAVFAQCCGAVPVRVEAHSL